MNPFQPSNELLHAYLDQQLDEPTRLAVEAYLASHPDAAAQVAGWRQDAQHLRAALANLEHLPGNPRLDPQAIRQRRRHGQRRLLATAAALILAVGIGGVGGWQARSQNLLAANLPMQDALEAHRLFALGPNQAVDLQPRDTAALQGWPGGTPYGACPPRADQCPPSAQWLPPRGHRRSPHSGRAAPHRFSGAPR